MTQTQHSLQNRAVATGPAQTAARPWGWIGHSHGPSIRSLEGLAW